MTKKLLIISYYWPPGSGPGVQRWLKFVKYLHQLGHTCTIVTVRNGSYPSFDSTLENEIPSNCNVLKTRTIEPFTLFNILQGKKGKQMQVAMADLKGEKTKFKKIANLIRKIQTLIICFHASTLLKNELQEKRIKCSRNIA